MSVQPVMEGEAVCVDETELAQGGIQMIDWTSGWVLLVSHRVHHLRQTLDAEFELGTQTLPGSTDTPSSRRAWQAGPLFSYGGLTVSGCITVPASVCESLGRLTAWMRGAFYIVQVIYNLYPGQDYRGWPLVPRHDMNVN